MDIWKILEDKKRSDVWDVFYERFKFKPSPHEKDWPSILEPAPSKTWFLDNYFELCGPASESAQNQLCESVAYAFKEVSGSGYIYILDWQHNCYEVSLNQDFLKEPSSSWKVPIVNDGEYTNNSCRFSERPKRQGL